MKTITPVIKNSVNIVDDMTMFAEENNLKKHEVDIEVLSHTTYYSTDTDEEKIVTKLFTVDELLQKDLKLRQEYEIKIKERVNNENLKLTSTFAINKTKTKAYMFIKPESKIPLKNWVIKKILDTIIMNKLRLGLFVDLFEPDLELQIKKFLKFLKEQTKLTLPYRILIAEAIEPTQPISHEMIFHYKQKRKKDIDSEDKVFKDELVAEYKKSKTPKAGRSCTGEYILPLKHTDDSSNNTTFDQNSFNVDEDEKSVFYYARYEGTLLNDMDKLSIKATNGNTKSPNKGVSNDEKLNILVVDDALIIRRSLKRMLEEFGHNVVKESDDGVMAIEDYKKYKPDLVTMDITMPNMDGIEAVGEIMQIDSNAKIIMVTAHGQEEMVINAISAGAKGYLLKPITPIKIRKELDKLSIRMKKEEKENNVLLENDDDDFLM